MRKYLPLRLTLLLSLIAVVFVLTLAVGQKVGAINYVLPDYDFFSAGPNVHLEIAQTGDGSQISLEAPETWVKFFFDSSKTNKIGIQMAAAQFICNPADSNGYFQLDSQGLDGICNDPNGLEYNFYCSDGSGRNPNFGSLFYSINGGDAKFSGEGYKYVFDGPTYQITSPCTAVGAGAEARYIVFMEAKWITNSPPEGRINGFKAGTYAAGALASYWASGSGYAVQNRYDQMPGEDESFNFEFAPQCDDPDTQTASLIWKDADAGSGGQPRDGGYFGGDVPISFDLFEGDSQAGPWVTLAHVDEGGLSGGGAWWAGGSGPDIGGNGEQRQLQFTAKRSKVYSWKWYNVNYNNGVQMTLPFDSYYYQKNCPPPPGGDQGVQGRVFNDVNNNKQYDNGEPIFANPSSACGGGYSSVPATVTAAGNTGNLNVCNPDPLYKIPTPPGTQTANLNVPPGWTSTNGTSRIVDVPNGSYYSMTFAQWFGIRQARQGVQGRVFIDDNDDGYFNKYTDQIVRNPGNACSSSNVYVPGVTVTATPPNATGDLSVCNAGNGAFIYSPDLYALYQIETPPGSINVRVNVPAGWKINNRLGANRTQYVSNNNLTSMATVDEYFAILPDMPSVTPYCSNGNSFANISWPNSGMSISGHYVDIGTSSNFAPGTFSNRYVGGSTSVSGAPGSFSGNPTGQLVEGATYYARIYYQGPNVHSAVRQFTADRCPRLTCGTLQPTEAESNDPIDMRVSFNNIGQGQLAAGANLGVSYTGTPNYSNGNTAYSARPLPAGQTALSNSGAISFSQPAGDYTITWTVTGDPRANSLTGATACTGTIRVSDKPYFRAYGGDVVVGISQPPGTLSCPGWNSVAGSSIKAFTTSSGPGIGKGAGVQLAAFALGQIDGFSTTTGQMSATPPGAQGTGIFPKGLAFANKGSGSGNSTYGGGSELPWCPPDYFDTDSRPAAPSSTFLTALLTPLTGLASDSYFYDATMPPPFPLPGLYEFRLNNGTFKATCLPLLPCNNLGNDDRITVYVNGDVIIDGDITYDTSNWSVGKIPSLYVIAKGNIYIQPNVTQIDGVYIAQEGAPGTGRIYTCANGKNVPTQAFLVDSCRTKLTVNGTLIAQRLRLFRLNNSRLQSSPQELSGSPTIAEMVSFGPETWLTVPAPFPPSTIDGYDAATSLPPTL